MLIEVNRNLFMSLDQIVKNLLPRQIAISPRSMHKKEVLSYFLETFQVALMFFLGDMQGSERVDWYYMISTLSEVKTFI